MLHRSACPVAVYDRRRGIMTKRRVVVTGMGVISPVGKDLKTFWDSLVNGRSGVGVISRFDASEYKTRIAAEVKDFNPEPIISAKDARRIDLFSQFGLCAAAEAVAHCGMEFEREDPFNCGVIFGSGIGGINVLEEQNQIYLTKGPGRVSPFYITGMIADIAAGQISIRYGLMGPNFATVSACATSAHSVGTAYQTIAYGDADVMLCGGSEGAISPTSIAGFINNQALSRRNDEPQRASRPFDKDRDGFIMGEGGAVLVLELLEHAQARGAEILAEITGVGFTADAHHITSPHPEGLGASKAMELAVARSGMNLTNVGYINVHGTSTPDGDIAETNAIKHCFGGHAKSISISSTKSMTGHLLGAAGALECAASIMALREGVIPPTINLDNQDPACDLNYTPNTAVERPISFALSNSFGFGGHNACIAIKKYS
jgi:3-oxoacyl-[acyl-carrier-protein] synthase II